jgi:glycerol-3-phosphate acyltransferase PlsY
MLGVWLLSLTLTGYVGLASILAGFSLIPTALVDVGSTTRLIFSVLAALLILFTHRSNVARLRAGCENRFERVRVFARLFARKQA